MTNFSDFIFKVEIVDANTTFCMPFQKYRGSYNCTINWGDGRDISKVNKHSYHLKNHVYLSPGIYTITMSGLFTILSFATCSISCLLMLSVEQWGNNRWMDLSFSRCAKLVANYNDRPDFSYIQNMSGMFENCVLFNGKLDNIDVSNATTMANMFKNANNFNQDISSWDISKVYTMEEMFSNSLSSDNYNLLLIQWSKLSSHIPNVKFDIGSTKHSSDEALSARNILTSSPNNWKINDDVSDDV